MGREEIGRVLLQLKRENQIFEPNQGYYKTARL